MHFNFGYSYLHYEYFYNALQIKALSKKKCIEHIDPMMHNHTQSYIKSSLQHNSLCHKYKQMIFSTNVNIVRQKDIEIKIINGL